MDLNLTARKIAYDSGLTTKKVEEQIAQLATFDIPEAQKYDAWRKTELWADIRQRLLANAEGHALAIIALCVDPADNQNEILGRRYAREDLIKLVTFVEDSGNVLAQKVAQYNELVQITRKAEEYRDNRFPISL